MTTKRIFTRVVPLAALAVAAIGSPLITSQAAQAAPSSPSVAGLVAPCYTSDDETMTLTFTTDCSTFDGIDVPDGWTVEGNGHTLTAVQDVDHPNFASAVLRSAVGNDSAPAGITVQNLKITTEGFETPGGTTDGSLAGIYLNRAGGTITNVEIDGISHGSGGQEGYGIFARNYVTTTNLDVPRAKVTLSGVKVRSYQKSGVKLDGNIAFTADHLDIGSSAAPDGTQDTAIAANSVSIIRSARGTITDSKIGENRYATDDEDAPEERTQATSVLLYNAGKVSLARNVISGTDGDTGLAINNYSNTIDTIASLTCNTITRNDGGNADSSMGDAIYNDDDGSTGAVDLTVGSNTFSGWTSDVTGPATETSDATCTTSTSASLSSGRVVAGGQVTVSGLVKNDDDSIPAGDVTLLKKESGASEYSEVETKAIDDTGDYSFTTTPAKGTSYQVSFSGPTFTDSTSPAGSVSVAPGATIHATPKSLKKGKTVTFTGTSTPALSGTTVTLTRYYSKAWHTIATSTLSPTGGYSFTWKAPAKSNPVFRVRVEKATGYVKGYSPRVQLKVS